MSCKRKQPLGCVRKRGGADYRFTTKAQRSGNCIGRDSGGGSQANWVGQEGTRHPVVNHHRTLGVLEKKIGVFHEDRYFPVLTEKACHAGSLETSLGRKRKKGGADAKTARAQALKRGSQGMFHRAEIVPKDRAKDQCLSRVGSHAV